MGVPLLFRWLAERYPLINRPAAQLPQPEVDNLYLDANGILHKSTHGDAGDAPLDKSLEEMMLDICSYIDLLVQTARPRRLLFSRRWHRHWCKRRVPDGRIPRRGCVTSVLIVGCGGKSGPTAA